MGSDLNRTLSLMETAGFIDWNRDVWENGCYVWLPKGYEIKNRVCELYEDIVAEYGYNEMQVPRLVPAETIERMADEFLDFREDVYWLSTRSDGEIAQVDWFLNSTSDAILNHILSDLIETRADLPFKVYMRERLFRPHSGSTRPFIDGDEITDIIETYSIRASRADSLTDFDRAVGILQRFHDRLALTYNSVLRPVWGNNPVADMVVEQLTYLPDLDRVSTIGTVYHHDQTFSELFDVAYTEDGDQEHVHQTAFGFGDRLILFLLTQHMDDYGFCLHPELAPTQVAIIPFTEQEEMRATSVYETLGEYRATIDRQYADSYQSRLEEYLVGGVPIRVGIKTGEEQIEISRRDTLERTMHYREDLPGTIETILKEMTNNLRERSAQLLASNQSHGRDESEIRTALNEWDLVTFDWCGDSTCGKAIESRHPGEVLGHFLDRDPVGKSCVECGEEASLLAYYGRRATAP